MINMQGDTTLQRFLKFKAMIVSSNMPNSVLLEMIESYITSEDNDSTATEVIPVLDGQLSLFDVAA